MDYGIALTPTAAAGDIAAHAEALGFTHAWFYDIQLVPGQEAAIEDWARVLMGT